MNVGQVKRAVANKLRKPVDDFVIGGVDELLGAMNSAKLAAEQAHDFEKSKKLVELTISSPQGTNLSSATLWGTATPVKVKVVDNVALENDDGTLSPIDFRKRNSVMAELRKTTRVQVDYFFGRYPPDYATDIVSEVGIREVMQYGDTILLRPMLSSGSVKLVMEATTWSDDYTNVDTTTDFFTLYGFNYLIWQSVVEANYIAKEFVYRQEGNLPSPEKLAEKYLQMLITYDLYSVEQNVDVTGD